MHFATYVPAALSAENGSGSSEDPFFPAARTSSCIDPRHDRVGFIHVFARVLVPPLRFFRVVSAMDS